MIFGCIFVEFSLVVFKFLRNNSNSEYCKKKKKTMFFWSTIFSQRVFEGKKKPQQYFSFWQVFHIVGHLVYWGKATIIYPLCETNVYVLSPVANTYT